MVQSRHHHQHPSYHHSNCSHQQSTIRPHSPPIVPLIQLGINPPNVLALDALLIGLVCKERPKCTAGLLKASAVASRQDRRSLLRWQPCCLEQSVATQLVPEEVLRDPHVGFHLFVGILLAFIHMWHPNTQSRWSRRWHWRAACARSRHSWLHGHSLLSRTAQRLLKFCKLFLFPHQKLGMLSAVVLLKMTIVPTWQSLKQLLESMGAIEVSRTQMSHHTFGCPGQAPPDSRSSKGPFGRLQAALIPCSPGRTAQTEKDHRSMHHPLAYCQSKVAVELHNQVVPGGRRRPQGCRTRKSVGRTGCCRRSIPGCPPSAGSSQQDANEVPEEKFKRLPQTGLRLPYNRQRGKQRPWPKGKKGNDSPQSPWHRSLFCSLGSKSLPAVRGGFNTWKVTCKSCTCNYNSMLKH